VWKGSVGKERKTTGFGVVEIDFPAVLETKALAFREMASNHVCIIL